MSPGILGKKIGMTQLFRPDGQVVPVTLLKAGPCFVVQRKTPATDGYDAIQLGLNEFVKAKRINKPETGHLKKGNAEGAKFLREFRLKGGEGDMKAGDKVLVSDFKPNEKVDVIGVSKGRGFAGRCEAASFRRRRRDPRLHAPPSARFDRRFELSVACRARYADGGTHGRRTSDGPESGNRRGGYRRQRAGGQRRGSGSQRRLCSCAEGVEVIMPTVDVIDLNNSKVGEIELADTVFGAEVNQDLLYESVRHYLAGQRAGTHKVKTRHEVAGSGKKLWKQKGTGRARMGSVRSPIWRHGGTVHGPVPRDYSYKLPRKMQLGALRSALSAKLRDGEMMIVSAFQLADHKTKSFTQTLGRLGATKKILVVENEENRNLHLSARNLKGVVVVSSHEVHPYHLLDATKVLVTQAAAAKLSETLAKSAPKRTEKEGQE